MIIIICGAVLLLAEIMVLMHMNRRNKEMLEYRREGESIYDNKLLELQLRNPYKPDYDKTEKTLSKWFIVLKAINSRQGAKYVYSLDDSITIGRARSGNMLVMNDITVSEQHCVIFLTEGKLILRDQNSANGVVVSNGLFKKYLVADGSSIAITDGCRITIGSMTFKVSLFSLA